MHVLGAGANVPDLLHWGWTTYTTCSLGMPQVVRNFSSSLFWGSFGNLEFWANFRWLSVRFYILCSCSFNAQRFYQSVISSAAMKLTNLHLAKVVWCVVWKEALWAEELVACHVRVFCSTVPLPPQLDSAGACGCVAGRPGSTSSPATRAAPAAATAPWRLPMKRWSGTSGSRQTGTG